MIKSEKETKFIKRIERITKNTMKEDINLINMSIEEYDIISTKIFKFWI